MKMNNAIGTTQRIAREKKTIQKMIGLYCHNNHGTKDSFYAECQDLLDYALFRIDCCPYGEDKPTCLNCPVHCYRPVIQEKIRRVLRYSGPRMLFRYPLLTVCHLFDGLHKAPEQDLGI
jgi:hypothetical protein